MAGADSRGSGRRLVAGVAVIAIVTAVSVFAFRAYQASDEGSVEPSPPAVIASPPPAPNSATPLAPPPRATRADLLAAATQAASRYAAGQTSSDEAGSLSGRRFRVVLPFGCKGPRDPKAESSAYWEYGPERTTIRISVQAEDWTQSAFARDLGGNVEAVEGFWIPRPWLASSDCPASLADPLAAVSPSPSPQTVGMATVFEAGASRVSRRGDRPFEVVLRAPEGEKMPAPEGFRLVLEGRVTAFASGEAVVCRSGSEDQRPVCLIGVELDRVTITRTNDTEVLGEWRS